jgi:hypothetical protein
MYRNKLFAYGAKHLLKSKGSLKSYKHKRTTGGSLKNLDNYLLSLVGGIRQMSVKPKKAAKSGRGLICRKPVTQVPINYQEKEKKYKLFGSGLKFVR